MNIGKEIVMSERETVVVNVHVEMSARSLRAIVENAKKVAGRDARGVYRVDTAETVSEMISRFLNEKNFESYASDLKNYSKQGPSVSDGSTNDIS
jgi:hypothetical protein